MPLVYRLVKGSPLTDGEGDGNISDLDARLSAVEAAIAAAGGGIDHVVQISATQFNFVLTNSAVVGPITLPVATLTFRGNWAPATVYAVNDLFIALGRIYRVAFAHTSASTFDPAANDGAGHNYYSEVLRIPSIPTVDVQSSDLTAGVFTLTAAHMNCFLRFHATASVLVNPNVFPQDADVHLRQVNTGQPLTIIYPTGVTVNAVEGHTLATAKKGATVWLKCVNAAANEFDAAGLFAAA